MRVEVDHTRCAAVGRCAGIAPEVFDQREEDGVVILLDSAPVERGPVREAALLCPAAAIVVHENTGGSHV
jgi:ferredoxin